MQKDNIRTGRRHFSLMTAASVIVPGLTYHRTLTELINLIVISRFQSELLYVTDMRQRLTVLITPIPPDTNGLRVHFAMLDWVHEWKFKETFNTLSVTRYQRRSSWLAGS